MDTTEPDFIDYNGVPYTKLTGFDGLGRTEYLRVTVDPLNAAGLFTWQRVPLI